MKLKDCIVKTDNLKPYSPEAHVGTVNRRIIGKETVGAENLEVVLGLIDSDGKAEAHFHTDIEQVIYLIEGRVMVEMWGETQEMGPGDTVYFPPGVKHRVDVLSKNPAKCLVIYSPPIQSKNTQFER